MPSKKKEKEKSTPVEVRGQFKVLQAFRASVVRLGLKKQTPNVGAKPFSPLTFQTRRTVLFAEAVASSLASNPHDGSLSDLKIDFLIKI